MTRLIQLADDAYELLARRKLPGESFSDLVRRHFPSRPLTDLVGLFQDMSPAERRQTEERWRIGREIAKEEIEDFYKSWKRERASAKRPRGKAKR